MERIFRLHDPNHAEEFAALMVGKGISFDYRKAEKTFNFGVRQTHFDHLRLVCDTNKYSYTVSG